MLIEYYTGRIAKVGGSPGATSPGLSACMYAGDMYVCMYVLCNISSQVPPYYIFSQFAKLLMKRKRSAQHSAAQPVEPTDAQRSALFGSYT